MLRGFLVTSFHHLSRRALSSARCTSSPPSTSTSTSTAVASGVAERVRSDSLNWLKTEEAQKALFRKENERTRTHLRDTEDLRQRIYKEILGYQHGEKPSCSGGGDEAEESEMGNYVYYSTRDEAKGLHRLCRRRKTSRKEQVLIDLGALAEEHGWVGLNEMKLSKDQTKVAFLVEFGQSKEEYMCIARDLSVAGAPDHHVISKRAVSIEWGKDNRHLYHTKADKLGRPYQVLRTDLRALWEEEEHPIEKDGEEEIIYLETDPNYYVDISVTKDWEYLTVTSLSRTSSEVWVMHMGIDGERERDGCVTSSGSGLVLLRGREEGVEYFVEHNNGVFFLLSNCSDPRSGYKLFSTPTQETSLQETWRPLGEGEDEGANSSSGEDEFIDMEMFRKFAVLYGRTARGQPSIKVMHIDSGGDVARMEEVPLDQSIPFTLHHGVNKDFDSDVLDFSISTPVQDLVHFRYNMASATLEAVDGQAGLTNRNRNRNLPFECKLIDIPSRDGSASIPVTLVYSKANPPCPSSPLLMQVYAAYGMNLEPQYDVSHFPLLDRGWCQVLVHARGGGECGKAWHTQARVKNKRKSMEDFQDVYRHLVANEYCDPALVAAKVHSAGALVLGATINEHPQMFKSVIANAPFVDLLSVMNDSSLPHTVSEYEEWGNPAVEEELAHMAEYCPYFNVRSSTALYPAILATSSTNDVRVPFWVVCKWIHRIRKNNHNQKQARRPVLLRGDLDANHFGKTGSDGAAAEASIENAFLIKTVTS